MFFSPSDERGVGQPEEGSSIEIPGSVPSVSAGVGDEPEPLSDVGTARARSAQIRRRDGKTHSFQVSEYSVEPRPSKRARNLLSKDNWRPAGDNESIPIGPQVPLIRMSLLLACHRERLARATACPDWPLVRPPRPPQGQRPAPDPGEEVVLHVALEVLGLYLLHGPSVHDPGRDGPPGNQPL